MKAYRLSVNLKLGLVLFAVLISVASLLYTNWLVHRLREREQYTIRLWASALEQLAGATGNINPYLSELEEIEALLEGAPGTDPARLEAYRRAFAWARSMPLPGDVTLASEIVLQSQFGIPAVLTDSNSNPINWQNVPVPQPDSLRKLSPADSQRAVEQLRRITRDMAEVYPPIPIALDFGHSRLKQYVYYDESRMVKQLRVFPYVQLLFVALFVLAGYLGFSYVRRSEQRSLWVGMAKEAAHQLGTPISSLMGWLELLRMDDLPSEQQHLALDEVEKDINRLRRVASRFSDIGSLPKLEVMPLAPVVAGTSDYIRRRIPQQGKRVSLDVSVPSELYVPLNAELFEWVIENLLKNALDAIEKEEGRIEVKAWHADGRVLIDVKDAGKGIDRRNFKNIFRPGFSTKKRGWGLGLSLAKRIVEDYHGGILSLAQSRPGHGATFRIELPAAETKHGLDPTPVPKDAGPAPRAS